MIDAQVRFADWEGDAQPPNPLQQRRLPGERRNRIFVVSLLVVLRVRMGRRGGSMSAR